MSLPQLSGLLKGCPGLCATPVFHGHFLGAPVLAPRPAGLWETDQRRAQLRATRTLLFPWDSSLHRPPGYSLGCSHGRTPLCHPPPRISRDFSAIRKTPHPFIVPQNKCGVLLVGKQDKGVGGTVVGVE